MSRAARNDKTTSLRERNRLRLRADLREAVLGLCDESDFSACTLENIARRTGCTRATVYAHYPEGRDEILCEIYEGLTEEILISGAARREEAEGPCERILALAVVVLEVACRPKEGIFFALLNPALSPVLEPVVGRASRVYVSLVAQDLNAVSKEQRLKEAEIVVLAELIVGAIREALLKVAQDPSRRSEMLRGLSRLISGVIELLSPQSHAPGRSG